MSPDPFVAFMRSERERVESALNRLLPRAAVPGTESFNEGLDHILFPGGKRLRAYMTLIAARLAGSSDEQALTLACAVEFIHTSSLIFDDLPSMDDADLRRRRRALHLVVGEATALLVAVALLNQAYALLAHAVAADAPAQRLQRLVAEACRCVGSGGMVAGQAAELAFSGLPPTAEVLASRNLKTTALMRFMLAAGALACARPDADIAALAEFGERLGDVYQIHDDLADALGDDAFTGKPVRQDARHGRPSLAPSALVREAGVQELTKRAAATLASADALLDRFGDRPDADLLRSAARFVLSRLDRVAELAHSPA